ncbi:MAG: NusG domain II-containing protein [bacterium]
MKIEIFKILKPGDYVVSLLIIFFIVIYYSMILITPSQNKIVEIIDCKNNLYRYSANDNYKLDIPGPYGVTEIQIKKGNVWVQKASCPHKTCKHMGTINQRGEMIICIPNRILIRIAGNNSELDGVSR